VLLSRSCRGSGVLATGQGYPILVELFLRFLKVGLVGFGGGWAILPIIEREVVEDAGWLTREEYLNLVAIAGSTPGPVAVNAATYVGYRLAGLLGAFVATVAVVLPPFTAITFIAYGLAQLAGNRYVQALLNGLKGAVVGLMVLALLSMVTGIRSTYRDHQLAVVACIALFVVLSVRLLNLHPIVALLISAAVGVLLGLLGLW